MSKRDAAARSTFERHVELGAGWTFVTLLAIASGNSSGWFVLALAAAGFAHGIGCIRTYPRERA